METQALCETRDYFYCFEKTVLGPLSTLAYKKGITAFVDIS